MLILKNLKNPSVWYFQSETGPNYYKEVPLSEILAVDSAKNHSGKTTIHKKEEKKMYALFVYFVRIYELFPGEATTHCFEIRTANVDFFVGEDSNVPQVCRIYSQ